MNASRIARVGLAAVALGALIALMVVALNLAGQKGNRPTVGSTAPDFSITLYDGYRAGLPESLRLSDLRGKVVVINFWGSWCKECEVEAEDLQRTYDAFRERDVIFLGVDYLDTEPAAVQYLTRFAVTYANGIDVQQKISTLYRITGAPETFIIDKQGRVAKIIIGGTTQAELSQELENALAQ